ncbi:hypothetical protein V6Z11_A11G312100 [Gossypium hirsutum]
MRAGSDMCVWRCVNNGRFSVAKAYRYLAEKTWEPFDNRWLQVWRLQAAQCCGLLCEGSFYLKNAGHVLENAMLDGIIWDKFAPQNVIFQVFSLIGLPKILAVVVFDVGEDFNSEGVDNKNESCRL